MSVSCNIITQPEVEILIPLQGGGRGFLYSERYSACKKLPSHFTAMLMKCKYISTCQPVTPLMV
jgi:hypothetical protein